MGLFRLLAWGCAGAAFGAAAAPGDLDPSFGTNGMVQLDALAGADTPGSLVIEADGKLLVSRPGGLWRLNPDGTPDQSFGAGGKTLSPRGTSTSTVLELGDGKIATGGSLAETSQDGVVYHDLAVTRQLSDGRADLAFGVGQGAADLSGSLSADGEALALLEQRDGKIVAAGSVAYSSSAGAWDYGDVTPVPVFDAPDPVLVRFDIAGSVDPSFGSGGDAVLLHASDWVAPGKVPLGGKLLGLAEQPDGALVAAGFMETQLAVARFTSEGVLDPTFGTNGVATLHVGAPNAVAVASAIAVQGDGKIVVAGSARVDCDPDDPSCELVRRAVVARFNADGSLDSTFAIGGLLMLDAGETLTEITRGGLALEPSGRIVVAGNTESPDGPHYAFVARLTAASVLDVDFGNGGVTLIDSGHGSFAPTGRLGGLARTPTGALAVAATGPVYPGTTVVAELADSGGHPGVIGLTKVGLNLGEGTDARFVVRRTGGTQGTVSVEYSTQLYDPSSYWDDGTIAADATDFRAESGTLTWADGDATERTISIPLTMDMLIEPNESFGFALSNVSGGAALAATDGYVWIVDTNLDAGELQFAADVATAREGIFALLNVTRTGGSTGAVDVNYGTVSGSADEDWDFQRSNGTLHWDNGDTSPKGIVVPITLDASTEPDETFSVWLHDSSGGATLGNVRMATVTIVDAPPNPSSNASATRSGGGGSLGLLDVLWLGLVTVAARVAQLNGGRARSRGRARADGR